MVAVLLDGITVRRQSAQVISGLTLRIEDGEAVALLGPSGSGKTTVLRAIAGFEKPVSGDVMFDNRRMNDIPPASRNLSMVFQDNVLIPHLDVRHNVGFPLKIRRMPNDEIARRVEAETRATGIANLLARRPNQLSAGQQQVVQLARAMVRKPDLMLVDEPFARLDPLGSERLRTELRLVQSGYGVTALYATHDFAEAVALADRVAVIVEGRIVQVGSSDELYREPADTFVASLVGDPRMAMLRAVPSSGGLTIGSLFLSVPGAMPPNVIIGVRPEEWVVGERGLEVLVSRFYSVGADSFAVVATEEGTFTIRSNDQRLRTGGSVHLRPGRFHVFDARTGKAVRHLSGW